MRGSPPSLATMLQYSVHVENKSMYNTPPTFAIYALGLVMKGPRRIYDAFYSSAGMLFAQRHDLFRPYHDTVFRRFWSHDLEIDELSAIAGVIGSIGRTLV